MLNRPSTTLRHIYFPAKFLDDPRRGQRLRSALWLYLVLCSSASPETGQLQSTIEDLAAITGQKPETISSLLGRLQAGGYVRLARAQGSLQIRLTDWAPIYPPRRADQVSVSDVGGGSNSPSLAQRIAEAFGDEANLAKYEELVEDHQAELVERAYREAAAMPASQVRKSRGALFTYLLKKYAQEQADREGPDEY